jgi:hypothetical protein
LEAAIEYYKPQEYVFCEISDIKLSIQELENVLDKKMQKLPSFDNGIASYLQRSPYLRLGYRQVKFFTGLHVVDMLKLFKKGNSDSDQDSELTNNRAYAELLDLFMQRMSKICVDKGVNLAIFYHPHLTINPDGFASTGTDTESLKLFKTACDANGVHFLDMAEPFMRSYNERHILPHGFWNTHVGEGHLNKNGHRIIAAELYNWIQELEKKHRI